MSRQVNQRELAEICDVTDVTIWEWQREGLPIASQGARGEANVYDTGAVIKFLIDRALARAGSTKEKLQLELLELDVKKKRAEEALREATLVPADQVAPIWESRVLAAAAYMTGRGGRLAAILETLPGIEAKRAELLRSDRQFLTHLGVNGEAMQVELEAFLARLPTVDVQQLFNAIGLAVVLGS
jgi:phage terminase Nu1 subunit (DNA packaging protein)